MDSWEEGFDTWMPQTPSPPAAADDTGTDLDRAELLRLARELAERRQAGQTSARDELEQLKQSLRERAEAVAARECELAELQRRLEQQRPSVRGKLAELRAKRGEQRATVDEEALAARERATLERAQALAERERELAADLAAAEAKLSATDAELELAKAERERLEERDRAVHDVEKQLAAARIALERERRELEAQATAHAGAASQGAQLAQLDERERALALRESQIESQERGLTVVRQELDTERHALLERERALRQREVAGAGESSAPPFAPPSFSEGLAALVRSRSRS